MIFISSIISSYIKMVKILFITSLILLFLYAQADQKYITTKDIPNENNAHKIAFTDDEQIVVLFSTKDNKIFFHRSFDLKFLHSSNTALLADLECYTDQQQRYSLLLGQVNGVISVKTFNSQQSQDQIVLTTLTDCIVKKVTASVSQRSYAVLCQDKQSVIIGSLSEAGSEAKTIDIGFTVQALSWHPTQAQLAVAGNDGAINRIITIDINTQKQNDYSTDIKKRTVDFQYSADGLSLAYISELTDILTIINLNNKTISNLIASQATQLQQIRRSGTLLSAYDTQNTYVWIFNSQNYGKYTSTMKSTGLSKTGGLLFTLDPLTKHIKVNQICPNAVFNNEKNICTACQSPCKTCFVKETQCSSCIDNYFFDEADLLCKICVQSCKVCIDAQICKQCIDGFFLDGNVCSSCFDKFTGCAVCNSTNCSKCLQVDNWQLYKGVCTCKAKFVQIQDKCFSCPPHCLSCNNTDACAYCDIFQYRKMTPVNGKCVCDTKYFQNINKTCQPCLTGCLTCDNKFTCFACDTVNHWALQQKEGSCVCATGYFLAKDQCTSCSNTLKGCVACTNQKTCITCDTSLHWALNQKSHTCTCQSGYIQSLNECSTCSALIEGCLSCINKDNCTDCTSGYSLNSDTKKCDKVNDGGVNVAVVIGVGISVLIGLLVGSYFIVRMIRKRNSSKKVETLLETEGEQNEQMT